MTVSVQKKATASPAAPGVPYYTPAQEPPAGTALTTTTTTGNGGAKAQEVPTLFTPLTMRGVTLSNRFAISPMCMYSADDGHLTDFHLVHLGAMAMRGAALTIIEATSVLPNGRITPEDSGLWQDSQIAPLRRVVDFIHSQGQKVGIQLAHAGRKAGCVSPWHQDRGVVAVAGPEVGGWPDNVWGPSAIPYADTYPKPREITVAEIAETVAAFAAAAKRAVAAGVDVVEVHGAHGYLISEFLSPISNRRTDKYGGSFENRTRLLTEVVTAVRAAIPESMPLFLRISATEWMEWSGQESWDVEQSLRLAKLLPALGVDLLDVSSGGNNREQRIPAGVTYQTSIAARIRAALLAEGQTGMRIGAVGMITTAELARSVVQEDERGAVAQADLVFVARQFLREPEFVLRVAQQLGVDVKWPNQYHRALWPKGARI